jgi:hypothetical protein
MIDRLAEIMNHQKIIQTQKFYVSFDQTGRLTSVFAGTGEPPENTLEITVDLAEQFLSGSLMKNKYKAVQLGDTYVLQKLDSVVNITTGHSYYKVPSKLLPNMLYINADKGTMTLQGTFEKSNVFYVCQKNCFHILYDSVVYDPAISTYQITAGKDIDVFVPSHVADLGVMYE